MISTRMPILLFFVIFSFIFDIYALHLDRVILAVDDNPSYLYFWPYAAQAWKEIVGIEPTLVIIDTEVPIEVDESLGTIIRVRRDPAISSAIQASFIRDFIPALFPNDVCIISDIDQLPAQREFFQDSIKNFLEDDLVIYREIKSDPNYAGQFPMCYIAGKGSLFQEIFSVTSLKEIEELMSALAIDFIPKFKFSSDQVYLYEKITTWNNWPHKVKRLGYDWIDRKLHMYNQSYGLDQLKKGYYFDVQLMKQDYWLQYPESQDFNETIYKILLNKKKKLKRSKTT